jgi:hypothetical protein
LQQPGWSSKLLEAGLNPSQPIVSAPLVCVGCELQDWVSNQIPMCWGWWSGAGVSFTPSPSSNTHVILTQQPISHHSCLCNSCPHMHAGMGC